MDINQKIKRLRDERGWSTYQLALEAGLTQSTLSSLLGGNSNPSIKTLECVCNAFGISLAEFFAESEPKAVEKNEALLLKKFRKLPADKQNAVLTLLD